ncbi:hypothetical protein PVAP13_4KG149005 [Panicum virgatum]|uniref:Uncharacterized protein n=1 Tax=Panicum virgatum TaxID=38727 RepID=A0A8T0TNG0_PANVG|nr:hypothetical protein PVAP13_4KG149005 [Panicum virgatum]
MPRSDPLLPLPRARNPWMTDHDGAGQEDRGCGATDRWSPHLAKAVLKDNRDPKLEMPHNQARAVAVEEKNLDGGIEEESNTGQRQREEKQSRSTSRPPAGACAGRHRRSPRSRSGRTRSRGRRASSSVRGGGASNNEQNGDGGHGESVTS